MAGSRQGEGQATQLSPSSRLSEALMGLARRAVGVPSGPLGWVSTRTLFPLLSGTTHQHMSEALHLRSDDELLEVACGSGAFLSRHASHVRRVAGIDLSDLQIDLARRKLKERIAAGTAEIVKGDAGALPWPEDSFTVVSCMGSFEAFPDPAQVLGEMFRVLRPGGRAVMTIGSRVPDGTRTERLWGMEWVWAEDDVAPMVERAGFTDVAMAYAPAWGTDPLSRFVLRLGGLTGNAPRDMRVVSATKP